MEWCEPKCRQEEAKSVTKNLGKTSVSQKLFRSSHWICTKLATEPGRENSQQSESRHTLLDD